MVDPVTTNRSFAVPTHGSDVDTWDVPVNANMSKADTLFGGIASISTTGGITTLNATQAASGTISVSGALASTATIVFPSPVQGWWSVENLCSGTSSFNLVLAAGAGSEAICVPPGCLIDIQVNGSVVRYRNLPMIGTYLDVATDTVPLWIQGCTKAPYLNCNGTTFSNVTYPYLAGFLGSTTLPDVRGRGSFYMNAGTNRLTGTGAGIDGNTLFAVGGVNGATLAANQIPSITSINLTQSISVNSNNAIPTGGTGNTVGTPGSGTPVTFISGPAAPAQQTSAGSNSISVSYTNASQQVVGNAAPGIVSGIRMIRAG